MPSEGWWSRHRLFPALSLTLTVPQHSRVHCSAGCAPVCAASIFTACTNLHCVLLPLCCYGKEKVSYHISHYLLLSRVITSVLQHIMNNRNNKWVQYFVWKVRKGRELWPLFKYVTELYCVDLKTVQ
jgi:hypothetical protein